MSTSTIGPGSIPTNPVTTTAWTGKISATDVKIEAKRAALFTLARELEKNPNMPEATLNAIRKEGNKIGKEIEALEMAKAAAGCALYYNFFGTR